MSDNLIPFGSNPERDKEIRRMGQKAQAEKKRRMKTFQEEFIAKLSVETKDKTIKSWIADAIVKQALKGNVKAYSIIEASIGEKPVEKVENKITTENKEALDSYLKEVKNGKSKNT